jgi:hypothetical protein
MSHDGDRTAMDAQVSRHPLTSRGTFLAAAGASAVVGTLLWQVFEARDAAPRRAGGVAEPYADYEGWIVPSEEKVDLQRQRVDLD